MSRARILVIDDSPTLRTLVETELTKVGFTVQGLAGRTPAMALAEDDPDLVLLGKVEAGFALEAFFTALRVNDALAAVPVVLLGPPERDEGPLPREVVDVVPRPFSPEALRTVVEHVLAQTRDPAAPRHAADIGSLSLVPADDGGGDAFGVDAALAGDLGLISLADVLALLDAEAQTGILTIRRADARLKVHFAAGRIALVTADGVPEEFLLGRFLVRGGALSAATLAIALEQRAASAAKPLPLLGKFLVDNGHLGGPALKRVLALQSAALVFESLRWGAGRFAFSATPELPELAAETALGLGVPALLLEGFRRVDEWRFIEREVGDFDGVFLRDEDRLGAFGRARLTREELSVLELCDGRRTVREVIEKSQLGAFDTTKMLYRLARTRLVRRRVPPVATFA